MLQGALRKRGEGGTPACPRVMLRLRPAVTPAETDRRKLLSASGIKALASALASSAPTLRATLRVRGGGCAASTRRPSPGKHAPASHPGLAPTPQEQQQPDASSSADSALGILAALDAQLVQALAQSDVRLVRVAWLCSQPADYRIGRRQELEALEAKGASPLLTAEEAAELLKCGDRRVGALSYGWVTAGDADPVGARTRLLVRELSKQRHIEALFWEYAQPSVSPTDAMHQWLTLSSSTCR